MTIFLRDKNDTSSQRTKLKPMNRALKVKLRVKFSKETLRNDSRPCRPIASRNHINEIIYNDSRPHRRVVPRGDVDKLYLKSTRQYSSPYNDQRPHVLIHHYDSKVSLQTLAPNSKSRLIKRLSKHVFGDSNIWRHEH